MICFQGGNAGMIELKTESLEGSRQRLKSRLKTRRVKREVSFVKHSHLLNCSIFQLSHGSAESVLTQIARHATAALCPLFPTRAPARAELCVKEGTKPGIPTSSSQSNAFEWKKAPLQLKLPGIPPSSIAHLSQLPAFQPTSSATRNVCIVRIFYSRDSNPNYTN